MLKDGLMQCIMHHASRTRWPWTNSISLSLKNRHMCSKDIFITCRVLEERAKHVLNTYKCSLFNNQQQLQALFMSFLLQNPPPTNY